MQVDPVTVHSTIVQVDITSAIFIVVGNLVAVVFAAGILYNKVEANKELTMIVNGRVERLEKLVDNMIVALVEKLGKNYGKG